MTDKEIIQALRICATHIDKGCGLCPQMKYVRCTERLADEAITMIERLTAENAALLEIAKNGKDCDTCKNCAVCVQPGTDVAHWCDRCAKKCLCYGCGGDH